MGWTSKLTRAFWVSILLIGCSKPAPAPTPSSSVAGMPERSVAPSASVSSSSTSAAASAVGSGSPPAPPCTPTATTACFRNAQLEDAALAFSHLYGRPVVVLGHHPLRVTGSISGATPSKSFDALIEVANRRSVLIDHFEVDGAHWIAPWRITRGKPAPTAKPPAGCDRKIDVMFQRGKIVRGLLQVTANLHLLTTEPSDSVIEVGEMSVMGRNVDLCRLLTHAIELAGGKLSLVGKKLVVEGGYIPSEAKASEVDAPVCPELYLPSSATQLPCFPIEDLEVTVTVGDGEKRFALVRPRYGRKAYSRSAIVRAGEYVGVEQMRVATVGDDGLRGEAGQHVPLAAPTRD